MYLHIKERSEQKHFHKFLALLNNITSFTWFQGTLKLISPLNICGILSICLALGFKKRGNSTGRSIWGNLRKHRPLAGQNNSSEQCQWLLKTFLPLTLDAAEQCIFTKPKPCAVCVLCCLCTVGSYAKWSQESIICVCVVHPFKSEIYWVIRRHMKKFPSPSFFSTYSPRQHHLLHTPFYSSRDCPLHGCTLLKSYLINYSTVPFFLYCGTHIHVYSLCSWTSLHQRLGCIWYNSDTSLYCLTY